MMKWSNLWKLKGDWCIEEYCEIKGYVLMFNDKSGLSHKVKLPPLVVELMKCEHREGLTQARQEMRRAMGV